MIAVPAGTTWSDIAGGAWESFGADITVTRGDLAITVTVQQIGAA